MAQHYDNPTARVAESLREYARDPIPYEFSVDGGITKSSMTAQFEAEDHRGMNFLSFGHLGLTDNAGVVHRSLGVSYVLTGGSPKDTENMFVRWEAIDH